MIDTTGMKNEDPGATQAKSVEYRSPLITRPRRKAKNIAQVYTARLKANQSFSGDFVAASKKIVLTCN